ncbi:BTAD domain-containing putative transcriptional regulator [Streptomyces collinus]|uniref:BTAD domain-containing putative transcriptional regulator n=1 Tax=Streptomyces collinus TaxID=42684 RepID=UPI00367E11AE
MASRRQVPAKRERSRCRIRCRHRSWSNRACLPVVPPKASTTTARSRATASPVRNPRPGPPGAPRLMTSWTPTALASSSPSGGRNPAGLAHGGRPSRGRDLAGDHLPRVRAEGVERAARRPGRPALLRPDGQRPRPRPPGERLSRALAGWGGQPYAEFADEPWTAGERTRLEEIRRTARERLAAAQLRCGQAAQALADAWALTREQPLHEEGWRLLALALWARDRQGDALTELRQARRVLAEELGVAPGPALLELEEALLHQRLDLLYQETGAPAVASAHPGPARAASAVKEPVASEERRPSADPTVLTTDRLLGRDEELARLAFAADRARTGRSQVVLVSGEAGIGKSSLLEATLRQLPAQGWLSAFGQCPESEGASPGRAWFDMLPRLAQSAPPGPYADELAALLAPGTASDPGQADGSPARRFRLHTALLGWLRDTARRQPLALFMDDLHRGDQESVELFLLCAEQLRDVPLLLVGSFRTGEGDLTAALARMAVCEPVRMALGGLSVPAAKALLRRAAADISDRAAAALAERAGGNPFSSSCLQAC